MRTRTMSKRGGKTTSHTGTIRTRTSLTMRKTRTFFNEDGTQSSDDNVDE
jgi:hypothetical protein